MLPRTRSGRVSKPPRHMVKDYKRLHHLDFAQPDLDDSDGGYSDYRIDTSTANHSGGGVGQDSHNESAGMSPADNNGDRRSNAKLDGRNPALPAVIPTSPFHCLTCKREYTTPHR